MNLITHKSALLSLSLVLSLFSINPAAADKAIAMQSGCLGCHQMDNKTVGPAIKDIAKKHQQANIDDLVKMVKNGKKSDQLTWGTIPMPPNAASEDNIRKVIEWMLTQQ